jgi:DSF synthase
MSGVNIGRWQMMKEYPLMAEQDGFLQQHLTHLNIIQDVGLRALWVELKYQTDRPCFTPELLEELQTVQRLIQKTAQTGYEQNLPDKLLFQVLTSSDKRAFSLGEDLSYIDKLIEASDREGLMRYAKTLIDIQYSSISHYDIPFTTIALIQGEALGGGFRCRRICTFWISRAHIWYGPWPECDFDANKQDCPCYSTPDDCRPPGAHSRGTL